MAQLIVRNIENDVKERLVERARRHGHSMEEEVRSILRDAVGDDMKAPPEVGFGTRLAAHFAEHGLDFEVGEFKAEEAKPALFD